MKLKLIDFLKGYSIFTIVVFHLSQQLSLSGIAAKAIYFGGAGVHVFVLCSGFGLCISQLGKPLIYTEFLKKRFLKIYIPYILIILLSAIIPFIYMERDKYLAVLSHVFLFKMFNEKWTTSFGCQFWFISMIVQFYLMFPILFISVQKYRWRIVLAGLFISLTWATMVSWLGNSELRIWNSFFLQYLWEFLLGMMLAIKFKEDSEFVKIPSLKYLFTFAVIGIPIVGLSGIKGGLFKLYNDIPSLVGYLSFALIVYSAGIKLTWINKLFIHINRFSYEWYLVHILVFSIFFHFTKNLLPITIAGVLALISSYGMAISYHNLLKKYFYMRI